VTVVRKIEDTPVSRVKSVTSFNMIAIFLIVYGVEGNLGSHLALLIAMGQRKA
jgi:hypothetical protein